ncbi:helix-turn-helix domain-containing protein [Streptomyces benahoarensis]|uniref:Helix-turn-helix transcriptional regulator n=1 Tax=Streptomyces benahoarensis TaxID=2595054 RepID=A0A553Z791_9ACTN|nr:helix-turn-helix transcriptional regulator [Streptomyces benahoarensis]TSB24019.1 helix-turn-helix transcriptional regulator [Streptomyces benahoarensis]TSB37292.1 helix-turn-helix transcriptional regulator [Streptomyces benahoarensis]
MPGTVKEWRTDAGSRNVRLRSALFDADLTHEELAARLGVDPKSVERWVNTGRTPYPRHAHAAAKVLRADAFYLWPQLGERTGAKAAPRDEVVACYASRGAVPMRLWREVLAGAEDSIDISVGCGLFLLDAVADLVPLLAERAAAGVRVWIALPDAVGFTSPAQAARAVLAQEEFSALLAESGVRLATHDGVTNDVVRGDDDLLVTTQVDGCTAAASPVLHLRRLGTAPLSGLYLTGLEHVFGTAAPMRMPRQTVSAVVAGVSL